MPHALSAELFNTHKFNPHISGQRCTVKEGYQVSFRAYRVVVLQQEFNMLSKIPHNAYPLVNSGGSVNTITWIEMLNRVKAQ